MAARYPLVLNGTSIQELQAADALATTSITTGAATTAGTITGNWSLSASSKLQSTYADLAEYYAADKEYAAGTVLVFGGDAEVTTTTTFGDSRVAGVVSENPAFILNKDFEGTHGALIALQGRVFCKVVGRVKKGDLLTTAGVAGHAVKAINPAIGTIIGKALANKESTEADLIEISVGRT